LKGEEVKVKNRLECVVAHFPAFLLFAFRFLLFLLSTFLWLYTSSLLLESDFIEYCFLFLYPLLKYTIKKTYFAGEV